jgi:hypothetical protein
MLTLVGINGMDTVRFQNKAFSWPDTIVRNSHNPPLLCISDIEKYVVLLALNADNNPPTLTVVWRKP